MIAGIVIATLVVGLLAYVLWALRAGGEVQRLDIEEQDGTTLTTVVVRSAKSEPESDVPVSTPLLRAAAHHNLAVASRRAMRRRRLGLTLSVLVSVAVVVVTSLVPEVPIWWLSAAPGIMLAWVCLTRLSVVVVGRHLALLRAEVERGNDEPTKLIELAPATIAASALARVGKPAAEAEREDSIDMDAPAAPPAKPSEPLLVSPPTYVSQPTLPRSVRRVDLSALGKQGRFPVNANTPQDELPFFFGEALRKEASQSDLFDVSAGPVVSAGSEVATESIDLPQAVGA